MMIFASTGISAVPADEEACPFARGCPLLEDSCLGIVRKDTIQST